jgi:DNA-binding PadR family transcriptional regulator
VQQGALYPAIYRLEREGLIAGRWGTSANNRRAKFYQLTALGRRQLAHEQRSWQRLVEAIARSLTATPQEI